LLCQLVPQRGELPDALFNRLQVAADGRPLHLRSEAGEHTGIDMAKFILILRDSLEMGFLAPLLALNLQAHFVSKGGWLEGSRAIYPF